MIIVVEGPDNAGKTTLGMFLAKELRAVYVKAERPRQGPDLLVYQAILESARHYSGVVVSDRHLAISEPIYGTICRGGHALDGQEIDRCIQRLNVVIYCRPRIEQITGHRMGDRQHMAGVLENAEAIAHAYDHKFQPQGWDYSPTLINYDFEKNSPHHILNIIKAQSNGTERL